MVLEYSETDVNIKCDGFRVYYNKCHEKDFFTVCFETFSQKFLIPSSCDCIDKFDLNGDLNGFEVQKDDNFVRLRWIYKSDIWEKEYFLDVYNNHLEYYYVLNGQGKIDTLRFFEGTFKESFREHIYLTKHFNDRRTTDYRTYSRASDISFDKIFNPEPNNYAYQYFHSYEDSQISAHADLDFCGGNFIFNPGILSFAALKEDKENVAKECFSLGIAVKKNEYFFSEFEYRGGKEFGLNLNYWGLTEVKGRFETPKIVITKGKDEYDSLERYIKILRSKKLIEASHPERERPKWWNGPIICGWGEQCYMADLFRVRSPDDRNKDLAAYYMCTQGNYEKFVSTVDEHNLDWKILCIDARWTLSAGEKTFDEGRWSDLRGFVDKIHVLGKKVIIWWGMWETEGLDKSLCICFDEGTAKATNNRPGRFSKFGNIVSGDKIAPDPTLSEFKKLISASLHKLLSADEGCYNLDGLKLDHVAATPGIYGLKYPEGSLNVYGIELTKYYQSFIYEEAKSIKEDALIIGQSSNPYFSECTDMIRLGDIYSTTESVVEHMKFRAKVAKIANHHWLIDMDNWPIPSLKSLEEYMEFQPEYGVPSLYYANGIDVSGEKISEEVFLKIKNIWDKYILKVYE